MEETFRRLKNALMTTGLLAAQAVISFRQNWGIGILSVVLAVSLWVYVTDQDTEIRTGRVPGLVPIEAESVPPDQAVFSLSEKSVTVSARAREDVFEGLTGEDFRATIDLSGVTAQQATVEVRVEAADPDVEVVESAPAEVTVRLEALTSRAVPVRAQFVGTPPRGFEAQVPAVQPQEAVVTGPERLVSRVVAAEADVNLTGVRTNFQEMVLLQARDERGGNIEGVNVEPESAVVSIELVQVEFSASFVVRADVSGSPAPGYNVGSVQVTPPFVVLTGPAEVFASLDPVEGIRTETVSVDGATADVVRTVALSLPDGVRVEQPDVTVRIAVAPAQGAFSYNVAIEAVNVPAALAATLEVSTVRVLLSGAIPDLEALDLAGIAVTVDLEGLDAGEHTVAVRVRVPAGIAVESVAPARVAVTLRSQ